MARLFPRSLLASLSLACLAISAARLAGDDSIAAARTALDAGDYTKAIALAEAIAGNPDASEIAAAAHQRRGEEHFREARIDASIADFDAFLALHPGRAPHHWQRGISLYYAARYEDGVRQFESHRSVNPQDVENAVWHFLCAARARSIGLEKARANFIPVTSDARVPMAGIHALFAGTGSEEQVIDAAESATADRDHARFYAHLYLGLYHEALGDAGQSLAHIRKAAGDYAQSHYMGAVARVHYRLRKTPK